ncbi:hypothetical protein Pth03_49390 [Planotetraspora thailandica]|uniref:Uncharacterized protein n=1 Tax=Planotetraspora thailandica TaxID=487172 RepID=A0A8J3VED0_9ACTN|nr:hypothetical protein [Planotetraspora thailandica]GII56550.1 hypothetical protein Pth03_49390 [Planotetraspora thailandica]
MGAITRVSDSSTGLLRTVLVVDAAVCFGAALLNFGLKVPLGLTTLRFADSIWQAGTGEAVIGAALFAAGLTGGRRLSWAALVMSVLGIAIGLTSERVQGAARDLHAAMVLLAVLVLALLLVDGRRNRRQSAAAK